METADTETPETTKRTAGKTIRNWLIAIGAVCSIVLALGVLVPAIEYVVGTRGDVDTLEDDVKAVSTAVTTLQTEVGGVKERLAVVETTLDRNHQELLDAIRDLKSGLTADWLDSVETAWMEP